MKRLTAALLALLLVLSVLWSGVSAAAVQTSAVSAILVDADSGRVLYEQNADEKRLIASITKLMTALVAVEHHPQVSDLVTIRPEWTGVEGSSMYLRAGEQLSLEALLYGLLLVSGNDAAVAVAGYCAGDVETFVGWMNQKAAELGMADSHFANPNGLNHEEHYSTAADMALLGRAVLRNETLAKIVSTRSIAIAGRSLSNHNKLLWQYEGCMGMKTGYTEKAGRTLVSCAERGGLRLIAVTLCDPNDWKDHAALYDYGFSAYTAQNLASAGARWGLAPVAGTLGRMVPVCTAEDVSYPLRDGESIETRVEWNGALAAAPLSAGTPVGRLLFTLNGETIGETPLVLEHDAADDRIQPGFWARFRAWLS